MKTSIPFQLIDWNHAVISEHPGESGSAHWKTMQFDGLRIRIVEYSPGYLADHWCKKGHIVHCLKGSFVSEMDGGEEYVLKEGMTYVVSDELSSHRSRTSEGVKLLIVDGEFLKSE
jgi:hypothetical protein